MYKPQQSAPSESSSSTPDRQTTLAVGIPTRGRPVILRETLADLRLQTRLPQAIFVCYYDPSDIADAPQLFPGVHFLQGSGGSCSQRNRLLDAVGSAFDLIFIMDDDCYLHRDYLLRTEQTFAGDPSIVAVTGNILLNGATGPGLAGAYARSVLGAVLSVPTIEEKPPVPAFNTDGCNMAFRTQTLSEHHVRFDEAMPGYAWYEDIDFSRRLLPYGRLVLVPGAQAVHLGAKVGKTSGLRYGYSQVSNPVYLAQKGTLPWPVALNRIARNVAANLARSLAPEPYIDRHGRLRGNAHAFVDLLRGRLRPDRILQLQ